MSALSRLRVGSCSQVLGPLPASTSSSLFKETGTLLATFTSAIWPPARGTSEWVHCPLKRGKDASGGIISFQAETRATQEAWLSSAPGTGRTAGLPLLSALGSALIPGAQMLPK